MEGGVPNFHDNDPVLVGKGVDVVVREGENFNKVIQCLDSSDEYPSAWAPAGEREIFPAEQFQGMRVGGFASCHAGSCRVDCGGCVGIGWFVVSGIVIFLVFRHLEP